ncbi:MAG: hypothetical protein AUK03_04910 [Anaerolineae bacterium CG2_30_64_16]|nr:MAG: hypothetical protein AUK03_04910 [Anaerolineae bacterium CG2_30_64_16]
MLQLLGGRQGQAVPFSGRAYFRQDHSLKESHSSLGVLVPHDPLQLDNFWGFKFEPGAPWGARWWRRTRRLFGLVAHHCMAFSMLWEQRV